MDTATLISALTIGGILVGMASKLIHVGAEIGQLQFQVKELWKRSEATWEYLVRRAQVATVHRGWGEMQSPLRIKPAAVEAVLPILAEMVPFYAQLLRDRKPGLSDEQFDHEVFFAFEQKFGHLIVQHLCLPHGLALGECLIAVIEACKETQPNAPPPFPQTLPTEE